MNTTELYNSQAKAWARNNPVLLSDFSARPFVLNLCEPIAGKKVLDAGCGEGYVGRKLAEAGALHVRGIDISEKMISEAENASLQFGLKNLSYEVGDIRITEQSGNEEYDLFIAMFLLNYLNVSETHELMKKAFNAIKPGGYFVFSVPHPFLAFLKKDKFPFYFEPSGGYFSGRNLLFPGEIWRRDGFSVGVQCIHKTFEDYFLGLRQAGFINMPEVYELKISKEHVELDPNFFSPLIDLPLHVAFKIKR
jgi:2-polyprenyl-3-methyl-5-hydroxy-6-metoxy-1,4-benzoquinol methylase